jgi:CheY-like chemotaxis protein
MSEVPLISIVDDDALARDGIRELVESLGYKATTFESAQHFLESSMLAETTCLITDVQMPGLTGLELQEALKSQGYHTPVILITAYPNGKHRTRALDNGAVGFLSKPFDEESLIKCLSAAVGGIAFAQTPPSVFSPAPFVDRGAEKSRIKQEEGRKKWSSCKKQARAQKIKLGRWIRFMNDCMAK